jgi:hypothetical protein
MEIAFREGKREDKGAWTQGRDALERQREVFGGSFVGDAMSCLDAIFFVCFKKSYH